jgi:hypothetical protein
MSVVNATPPRVRPCARTPPKQTTMQTTMQTTQG